MPMNFREEESTPLVLRDRGGSQKSSSSVEAGLQVHIYFFPGTRDATVIQISSGQISAENVCIQAGKKSGILPVYLSLFGLASADLSFWYPPSHMFDSDENLVVHFRVRFFFGNWFGQGPRTSYRYSLTKDRISLVLDYNVIDYLFAQLRSDFIASEAGIVPPLSAQEECLGLAVLDLWRMAKERRQTIRELCKTVSYKSCLPKSHRHEIQKRNRLDRFRIRNTLKRFLKKLGKCSVDEYSLKLKYLIELAGIEPSLGSETFRVNRSSSHAEATFTLLRVCGETGIQTGQLDGAVEWQTFCDFHEIVDISIKRILNEMVPQDSRMVTITRKDDRCLEASFQSRKEALSFMSLIDGYFRLITDSSHFFCQDIAPPSLLEGLKNYCHGPITSEFAVNKLKRSGCTGGTFLIRQSPKNYENFFLTVCVQTPLGLDYKDCLIIKNESYSLPGLTKSFSSLTELTNYYQHNKLLLAEIPVKLTRCCPPRPKELTNLIIVRNSSLFEAQGSPAPERNKFSHIQIHMIKFGDLNWGDSLGQGTFTRIFKGYKTDFRDGEKRMTEVILKELDSAYKNCWESLFEAASLMSQISHKHLLHVYGVSVHGSQNIMVQEFVKYGALDLYLKRGTSVSVSWKLSIAKQLACALNFLEEQNIVHGNICAKNLLLAREGDPSLGSSPFIKLSDPGISVVMMGNDVILDRIPWVAPEVLDAPDSLTLECDKWSFGATVWEIFNDGNSPLRGWNLDQKRNFYENMHQLPPSQWTELADLIAQCMDYDAAFRPSCRSIIRQLNSLITSDYVILHATEPVTQSPMSKAFNLVPHDQTLFEERHLCYISPLGKGNFGCVELCRYDPLGDNTGELVAVKKLQPNKGSNLEDFQKEVKMLSVLHCDYIVKYRGVCYSMGRLSMSLVMEYLPYGSLNGYVWTNRHNITTRRMLLFSSQICKGMEYLQMQRYVHRDLAARNILVANESLVKIADFGLTKVLPFDKEYYRLSQPGQSPLFWLAPECLNENKFSHKSDVWSFGIVLHELFSYCDNSVNPKRLCLQEIGQNVQGTSLSMHLANMLASNWRLPAPPNCPLQVYSLMKDCWTYDFDKRPSFSDLSKKVENMIQDDR
ncbi:PREDICTED: tyrosine-protein kinase JAK3 isoform X2 [Poecilia mexicana]|uniref:Tyrosine-protein kinase n=2 Tax=Poecilia mexicana TaxID=48701 RepID=A0A3B3Z0A3_9TELE|nr:PREDICTED: tyrosine-protein kinase JAK3 isoform X2 [Poecilia mexicana]XP_014836010.1 PREDICTED: tyrosine-protein kinase JAK3 isoform X2 [Poecilia mexicana]XP_014836011.1 PREDICTED: tyrosine-protein kinase JAK3 isoform X2 [Poecilia mexicana]